VNINDLVGYSISRFVCESKDDIIAAVYEEEDKKKPSLMVANNMTHLERYKDKGILLMSGEEFDILAGTGVVPAVVAKVFPNSDFIRVERDNG
jgi:hypothetical protein